VSGFLSADRRRSDAQIDAYLRIWIENGKPDPDGSEARDPHLSYREFRPGLCSCAEARLSGRGQFSPDSPAAVALSVVGYTLRGMPANEAHGAPVQVRARSDSDLDACSALLLRVHRHDAYPVRWPADPARWLSPSRQEFAWVATDADRAVVGHVAQFRIAGHPMSDLCVAATGLSEDRLAVLSRLIVDPRMRGRGIARALVQVVEKQAHSMRRQPVLDVAQVNDSAISLYEHLGWKRVGELRAGPSRDIPVHVYAGPVAP
jgi:ribosomal protein S18 acetylase RimI-like enzyme